MTLSRRQAWPALLLLAAGLLALTLALRSNQDSYPLQPVWLMGVCAGFYVLLGLVLGGFSRRWPVLVVAAGLGHLLLALLMGWGYAVVAGETRGLYDTLAYGLWDYVPGCIMQAVFAGSATIVLSAWLSAPPPEVAPSCESTETVAEPALPDLFAAPNLRSAVVWVCTVEGVAAALLASQEIIVGAGDWESSPAAAGGRVRAVSLCGGEGLNSLVLGEASLLTRCEEGIMAALLVSNQSLDQGTAHELLRDLYQAGTRLLPPVPTASA
jgi:peptidoglycan/LPS O-acetylase OafA/YrhL